MFTSCNFTSKISTLLKCTNFIHISLFLLYSFVYVYAYLVLCNIIIYVSLCIDCYTTMRMKYNHKDPSCCFFSNHAHLSPTPNPTFNPWQPLTVILFLKFYYIKTVMNSSYKFCKKLQR